LALCEASSCHACTPAGETIRIGAAFYIARTWTESVGAQEVSSPAGAWTVLKRAARKVERVCGSLAGGPRRVQGIEAEEFRLDLGRRPR